MIAPNDLYWLERRFEIAAEEVRRITPAMLIHEMREALKEVPGFESLTIEYEPSGHQKLTIGDKTVEVGPMASNAEIVAALQNPFIPTANTKVKMVSPLQGIGQKLAKLKHDAELDALDLSKTVDDLATRKDAAIGKAKTALQGQGKDIEDIEAFVADVEKATNA